MIRRTLASVLENLRSAKMALMSYAMVGGNEGLYDIIDRDIQPAMNDVERALERCSE